MLFNRRNKKSP